MENSKKDIQIIGFKLNEEEYALEISSVQEIIKIPAITRVPRAKKLYFRCYKFKRNCYSGN